MATASPAAPGRTGHAVVIGGSIAGLWAARVLADHVARVTVVERDQFPDTPTVRKGVPQARHVHVLLAGGMRVLDRLLPGLDDELAMAGAPLVDWLDDCRILAAQGWLPRFPSGIASRTCSRALLEWSLRRRLLGNPRIAFLPGHDALGLLAPGARVAGVMVRRRDGTTQGPAEELRADLIVDASGRDTKTPAWLRELGYGAVAETTINAFLGYATRWYRRPAGAGDDWRSLFILSRPPHLTRGGVIFPVEGDAWAVTLSGIARDYPPQDEAGFLDFARSLPDPALYEAIKAAEPLTPVYGYRRTENRLRHYERLPRWPLGFVALGDAVCAFNPVYGQGMTASANAALTLDRCLRAAPRDDRGAVAPRFQRALARTNAAPWTLATSEDFRWPATEGGRPDRRTRLMHGYMNRVIPLLPGNAAAARTFVAVLQLVAPPRALFRPAILGPVIRGALPGRRAGRETRPGASVAPHPS